MAKSYIRGIAALAVLACGAARAQDFLSPGPAGSFAGPEVGVTLGAAVGGAGDVSTTGVAAGLNAGYMLQNGPLVGGLEGDAMLGSLSGAGRGGTLSQNWLSSLRVRGGWAFGNILAYATVGPAWGSSNFSRAGFNFDKSLQGYAIGVGGEAAVMRNVSVRAELRHYDFGAATYYMPGLVQKIGSGNNFLLVGVGAHF